MLLGHCRFYPKKTSRERPVVPCMPAIESKPLEKFVLRELLSRFEIAVCLAFNPVYVYKHAFFV